MPSAFKEKLVAPNEVWRASRCIVFWNKSGFVSASQEVQEKCEHLKGKSDVPFPTW